MKSKKYKITKRKLIFDQGPVRLVDCEVLMPDGKKLSRQILEHSGAVVIIPKIGKDRFLLIRQFRFATGGWLWEFPAGGLEPGEPHREAAARELAEETGYAPRRLTKVVEFYPTPGISAEIMYLYLAEDLKPHEAEKDEDEEIEVREVTLKQLSTMIRKGQIIDAKTLISYCYLKNPKCFS